MIPGLYEERKPKPLQAQKPLRRGGGIQRGGKRLGRALGNDSEAPKRYAPATFKDRTRLAKRGRRGIKLEGLRAKARAVMYALWGRRCIYPGCNSQGPFEAMHAYGKGSHAELDAGAKGMTPDRAALNLFPGCLPHHRTGPTTFEFTPHLKDALMECADEMLAAQEGKRPQPSWEELQGIVTRYINEAEQRRRRG